MQVTKLRQHLVKRVLFLQEASQTCLKVRNPNCKEPNINSLTPTPLLAIHQSVNNYNSMVYLTKMVVDIIFFLIRSTITLVFFSCPHQLNVQCKIAELSILNFHKILSICHRLQTCALEHPIIIQHWTPVTSSHNEYGSVI